MSDVCVIKGATLLGNVVNHEHVPPKVGVGRGHFVADPADGLTGVRLHVLAQAVGVGVRVATDSARELLPRICQTVAVRRLTYWQASSNHEINKYSYG